METTERNRLFAAGALLARLAVTEACPGAKFGESGLTDDGFYLDVSAPGADLGANALPALAKAMAKIARGINDTAKLAALPRDQALERAAGDPYATELIAASNAAAHAFVSRRDATVYAGEGGADAFAAAARVGAVHLFGVGGAYWRGDKRNAQLVRLTGCAFASPADMKAHLGAIEAQRARDHRRVGRDLEIFAFDPLAGQGMPLWLRNGAALRAAIGAYVHECEARHGYEQVSTPILGSVQLYKTSGHFGHYAADMFPILDVDGEQMMLRPMTCPHHCLVYKERPRSYRELPLRLCEDAILHRYEKSGALTGLERVRTMTLLDTHVFCRPDQIEAEILAAYAIVREVTGKFGLRFDRVDLSLRDPNDREKYVSGEEMWSSSEAQLASALDKLGIKYERQAGEAAFYGPKIDFQCRTALNKLITVSTIQLDFSLPEKFGATYRAANGSEERCVIVHVGIIGTYERFIATLLEQTGGALPFWLAPVQAAVIPVDAAAHGAAAAALRDALRRDGVRCFLDMRDERLGKKIRDCQVGKIPLQLVVGDREASDPSAISYRRYGAAAAETMPRDAFFARARNANAQRTDWEAADADGR